MTAKVDKIKALRQDLRERDKLIKTLKSKLNAHTRKINDLIRYDSRQMDKIKWWADSTRRSFDKEFMWLKLTPDKSSPFHALDKTLQSMKICAELGLKETNGK